MTLDMVVGLWGIRSWNNISRIYLRHLFGRMRWNRWLRKWNWTMRRRQQWHQGTIRSYCRTVWLGRRNGITLNILWRYICIPGNIRIWIDNLWVMCHIGIINEDCKFNSIALDNTFLVLAGAKLQRNTTYITSSSSSSGSIYNLMPNWLRL